MEGYVDTLLPGWEIRKVLNSSVLDSGLKNGKDHETVVLLHGFPDNIFYFYKVAPQLVANGYRVLIPSLIGYEQSTVTGKFNDKSIRNISKWIIEIIQNIIPDTKFHLVGHDWGSAIAEKIALTNPTLILSLSMSAVPHRFEDGIWEYPMQLYYSWYMAFFQLPWIPEHWLLRRGGLKYLWNSWSPSLNVEKNHPMFWKSVLNTFQQPGVASDAVAYYRMNVSFGNPIVRLLVPLLVPFGILFAAVKPNPSKKKKQKPPKAFLTMKVPVLGLCGSQDGCIMPKLFRYLHDDNASYFFPAGHEFVELRNAGHFSFLEAPEEISAILVKFMKSHPLRSSL